MLDFGFDQMKGSFFDPAKILKDAERLEARIQSKFGAYTRRTMKSSIKYATGSASAGQPPFAHRSKGFTRKKKNKKTGATSQQQQSPLRELIYFARDSATGSVVIGPVVFGKGRAGVIEKGGGGTFKDPRTGLVKTGHWAPHPFAEPAGRAEAAKFPDLLRSLVK